ncbi:AraC family transcriptional regulator [Paenibacillus eucommiae]|uniref:AraC-like DNA-binding protein n=1 Tax=Paenibacillus eucommiae TaxID=1355755 RepID=A0ABS4ISF7_9BACL|nr:helix-turn-helix domain-containing protein [Paenibacillus eucommiae]MBP1990514.1 AraC-like DNA-binding protein [Paenibacillus eucommiae]
MKAMNRQGYYRWLLSYLPVFFVIISVLILIFFLSVSGYSRNQALRANEVFAGHVMKTMDSTLKFTEKMIIKEIVSNDKLQHFFDKSKDLSAYDTYEIARRIKDLVTAFQPIDSIYLYRVSDQMVLTPNTMVSLQQFGDQDFVNAVLKQPVPQYAWTGKRDFREFPGNDYNKSVVSLVQKVPLNSGNQGVVVVNVRTDAISDMFRELVESDIGTIHLQDAHGRPFFENQLAADQQMSEIISPYTGWIVQTSMKNKQLFNFFSALSRVWVAAGLATVAAGIGWLIFLVRRNYRPIEEIKLRIEQYASQKSAELGYNHANLDEYAFINEAIENLVESSNSYEKQYRENLVFRKRWLFNELMEGERYFTAEQWQVEADNMGLMPHFKTLTVAVLEMDYYADFCQAYTQGDQHLLKFAITSVVKEMAQNQLIQAWSEWIGHDRVGILFFQQDDDDKFRLSVSHYCEHVRSWIADHLKLTVAFGIGGEVMQLSDIPQTLGEALEALDYKSAFGGNKVIGHWEIEALPQSQMTQYVPGIRALAQSYRLGEEQWQEHYHGLFTSIQSAVIRRDDRISLLQTLVSTMQKEMSYLPVEMSKVWEADVMEPLNRWLLDVDHLHDINTRLYAVLDEAAGKISLLRDNRDNYKLVRQVKAYMEEHFANPDLSLTHLSEEFGLNTKTLSRIFKEEFGEKFVDYLTKIRLDHAKHLLQENPSEPVQDIAQKVGYLHSITFIRVFKKLVGMTPSDFRKEP